MFEATVKLKGLNLEKTIKAAADKAGRRYVSEGVIIIHRNALKLIQKTSVGERETRYNPKRKVIVSKEGDAPNIDTGRLINSIQFGVLKIGNKWVGLVGSDLKYAAWLEVGTKDMGARPWLAPALKMSKSALKKLARNLKLDVPKKGVK